MQSDDQDIINMFFDEMNPSDKEESISVSDVEQYEAEEESDEQKDLIKDDNFPDEQFIVCLNVGMVFLVFDIVLHFYKEYSHLNVFGIVKSLLKNKETMNALGMSICL